jgi:hypothetical protein
MKLVFLATEPHAYDHEATRACGARRLGAEACVSPPNSPAFRASRVQEFKTKNYKNPEAHT